MKLFFTYCLSLLALLSVAAAADQNEKPSPIRTRVRAVQAAPAGTAVPAADIAKGPNTGTACYHDSERALTAVHPSYPVGSRVKVTNLRNQKTVIVTISGHAALAGRLISLSRDAADELGFVNAGTTSAKVDAVRD